MIQAFQACGPGSTPGRCRTFLFSKKRNVRERENNFITPKEHYSTFEIKLEEFLKSKGADVTYCNKRMFWEDGKWIVMEYQKKDHKNVMIYVGGSLAGALRILGGEE